MYVLVTFGAGDIDKMVPKIKDFLKSKAALKNNSEEIAPINNTL